MLALINLIIRRTRLAFRTPARLALFPLLSQSGCFILQLPTGFYSHCCGSGSEPSRREQRERGWIRPRPPDGRAVLCRPGGKQRAGGGTSRPRSGGGMGPGVRAGGAGVGGSAFLPRGAKGSWAGKGANLTAQPYRSPSRRVGGFLPPQKARREPAATAGPEARPCGPHLQPALCQALPTDRPAVPGAELRRGQRGLHGGAKSSDGTPESGRYERLRGRRGAERSGRPGARPGAEQVSAGLPVLIKLIKPPIQH